MAADILKEQSSPPPELATDVNHGALAYIGGKSAHSDVGDALLTSVKPLGDVQLFCTDWRQFRSVAAATRNIIFAFAAGMNSIGFRLDDRMKARALASGGAPCLECGQEWITFVLFRDDWPKIDLEFWARKACFFAREQAAGRVPL